MRKLISLNNNLLRTQENFQIVSQSAEIDLKINQDNKLPREVLAIKEDVYFQQINI